MKSKTSISTVLITVCFVVCSFAQERVEVTQDLLKTNVEMAPCKNSERLEAVKKLFGEAGAMEADLTVEKFKDISNVVVTKKGNTDDTVLVTAHYDKVKDGCGAIDNWTGIVIIANLYRTMRNVKTTKTYKFVAFDKEEEGLLGSEAMAKEIPKEKRPSYCSNVNLDSFGFSYPQILDNASTPKMAELAKSLASDLKMPLAHASLMGVADADSSSFKTRDIPAITFHGLNAEWQKYLHSNSDQAKAINISSVWVGYQFLLRYLTRIDEGDCGMFRKAAK
jgi:Zn-dependent M28 family amino/carboxypeptidase